MFVRLFTILILVTYPLMVSAEPEQVLRLKASSGEGYIQPSFQAAIFSPDGKAILASESRGVVKLWDAVTGDELKQLKGHRKAARALAFTPNGRLAITGSKRHIVWWDVATGKPKNKLTWRNGWVNFMKYSPDVSTFMVAGEEEVHLFDTRSGETIRVFTEFSYGLRDAEFALNSKQFVAAELYLENVWFVDVQTGKSRLILDEVESAVVEYSPDRKLLFIGGQSKRQGLYSAEKYELIREMKGHQQRISTVDFSPDGKFLIAGSLRGYVRIWRVEDGQKVLEFLPEGDTEYPISSVEFSPDGKRFLTHVSSNNGVAVWKMPDFEISR